MVKRVVEHEGDRVGGIEKGRGKGLIDHGARSHDLLDLAIPHAGRVLIQVLVLLIIVKVHFLPPAL